MHNPRHPYDPMFDASHDERIDPFSGSFAEDVANRILTGIGFLAALTIVIIFVWGIAWPQ